ncbi:MAG: signal peptidase I [Actinomycetia bacterium]|nr:signal peptidase I [Actinomycetes bacterium]
MNPNAPRDPGADRPQATPTENVREQEPSAEESESRSPDDKGPVEHRRSLKRSVLEILIIVVIAAVLAVFIQSFALKTFIIPSSSMSPTLQIGDRVMVDRVTYYFRKPRGGDIIVFRFPPTEPEAMNTSNPLYWPFERIGETLRLANKNSSPPYVKRVVATEGETVELRKGILYIDGKKVDEEYVVKDTDDYGPEKVPEGMLLCLGDNRANSRDGRFWGMVPIRSVIGRVFLIWWPPSHFGKPG